LASIIEKRLSLHKNLAEQRRQNTSLQSQLIQFQSLANIGAASCMIAHEINNILTPLVSYAAMALEDSDDRALVEKALDKTIRGCEQATKVMESMLALANGQNQDRKNVRLITLVEGVFACLCRDFKKDGITVKINIPEVLTIWAAPVQMQHTLMNLILNARDAMLPRGGILTISAKENNDAIRIEVTDTGCGIEPANLKKIFEPFFTTKTDKKSPSESTGSGLGLAFCKKIIEAHDGCISVESAPAQGTAFTISLPKPPLGGS
jgi:two-component system NtrC family sensor kinase